MERDYTGLYCAKCGTLQHEDHAGKPCIRCSGLIFAALTPTFEELLTDKDLIFLKQNRIKI